MKFDQRQLPQYRQCNDIHPFDQLQLCHLNWRRDKQTMANTNNGGYQHCIMNQDVPSTHLIEPHTLTHAYRAFCVRKPFFETFEANEKQSKYRASVWVEGRGVQAKVDRKQKARKRRTKHFFKSRQKALLSSCGGSSWVCSSCFARTKPNCFGFQLIGVPFTILKCR